MSYLKSCSLFPLISLLLGGCALFTDLGPLSQVPADLGFKKAEELSSLPFPNQQWWTAYNDPQLKALIEEGLQASPTIAEAVARLKKSDAVAMVAGAPLYPTLDVEGSLQKYKQSYNEGIPSVVIPHGFRNFATLTANFNYEIDFWGKNRAQLNAALSDVVAAQLDAALARIMVSTSVATAYAELAQLCAELGEAEKGIKIREQTIKMFNDLYTHGLANRGGLEQARADLALAEADLVSLHESIALKKLSLAALVGKNPARAESIHVPNIHQLQIYSAPSSVPADLIGYRPDLMAARMRVEAEAYRIQVARAGYYPNVNLAAYIGLQSLGLDLFFRKGSMIGAVGPAIYLPIFEGGKIEGRYRGARADYEIAIAQYESAIVQALQEVANVLVSQKAQVLEVQKMREAVAASQQAYQVNYDRYKEGIANYIEVLNSENTLISSRRNLARVVVRAFVLDISLIKALGGGFQPVFEKKVKP